METVFQGLGAFSGTVSAGEVLDGHEIGSIYNFSTTFYNSPTKAHLGGRYTLRGGGRGVEKSAILQRMKSHPYIHFSHTSSAFSVTEDAESHTCLSQVNFKEPNLPQAQPQSELQEKLNTLEVYQNKF